MNKWLKGHKFISLNIIRGHYITSANAQFIIFRKKHEEFKKILDNKANFVRIESVECKGKKIYIELCIWRESKKTKSNSLNIQYQNGLPSNYAPSKYIYLVISMGSSGSWSKELSEQSQMSIVHTDNSEFAGNQQLQQIYFEDSRQVGRIEIVNGDEMDDILDSMGVDVMSDEFTLECFIECVEHNGMKIIANFLIDQSILSGVGIVYRSEILYIAKINPFVKMHTLTKEQIIKLHAAIKYIMLYSYLQGGISLKPSLTLHKLNYQPLIYGRDKTKKGENVNYFTLSNRAIYTIDELPNEDNMQ